MSRSVLNLIGVVILLVGLGSVALIERNARIEEANAMEDSEATDQLLHPEDYGSYVRGGEMIGGKMGVLLNSWVQGLEGLGHSRPFAMTIAIISLIAATTAFTKSALSPRD